METTDYLIIGAGIVGLTVARELQLRNPGCKAILVDKEGALGMHGSGRNSGVLHSGIYYQSDTLKARFTREGNEAWQSFCQERSIPIERCGKLIVAKNVREHEQLVNLENRGSANGVEVHRLDKTQVREIEPRAKTFQDALFVPSTAVADPLQLLMAQYDDFVAAGGILKLDSPYHGVGHNNDVKVGNQCISAGKVINCAGLYADKVAHTFGFGLRYTLLPFKGLYHYAAPDSVPLRCHVYPVPDLSHPFLGVHFTRTLSGRTKIGPTAIPSLWREHYSGFGGFRLKELAEVSARELQMLITNKNQFRALAWREIQKYDRKKMIYEAAMLLEGAQEMGFREAGKAGIRAQLIDCESNAFVMDFVIEGDSKSIHVLNAISPAWTCAIPFARYVVDYCHGI